MFCITDPDLYDNPIGEQKRYVFFHLMSHFYNTFFLEERLVSMQGKSSRREHVFLLTGDAQKEGLDVFRLFFQHDIFAGTFNMLHTISGCGNKGSMLIDPG